jgi:hypothetical protein
MKKFIGFGLALGLVVLMSGGCRKRGTASGRGGAEAAPSGTDASGEATATSFAAPLPPAPSAPPPVHESAQFYPTEPVNMYAAARPGDYQTQLDAYNRVLRKWTENNSLVPNDFNHLMAIYNGPKPPQPPAGRRLMFDRKTVTVRLQ